jgi:predicted nucleotidyltransferase
MNKLIEALSKQKQILELKGYTVAYICVYGSQNYGLDIETEDYQSDIDMKAIIVPTLDDLVRDSKPVSKVYETEWGQVDVKDIRPYFHTLLKANPAYIETLFTPYAIIDERFEKEWIQITSLRDKLVETLQAQFIRAMYGMMCEKEKALTHPYPTIAHKIEKWGWDGKQLHHILRLWLMMMDYFSNGLTVDKCLHPSKIAVEGLIRLKTNEYPLEKERAVSLSNDILEMARHFKDDILSNIDESKIDYSVKDTFLSLSQDIIKNKIILESLDKR